MRDLRVADDETGEEEKGVATEMEHGDEPRTDNVRRHVRPYERVVSHHRGAGDDPEQVELVEIAAARGGDALRSLDRSAGYDGRMGCTHLTALCCRRLNRRSGRSVEWL